MKVALIHDWLIHMRGGEKVLEALAELFPDATIYTLFYDRRYLSPTLRRMKIKPSFLQYLPGICIYYRWLLPLFPWAIRSIPVEEAVLVISSSHCVAKAAKIPAGAYHLCYCHTPMRYVWGFEAVYFSKFYSWIQPFLKAVLSWLRCWDLKSNTSVNQFICNSENVRDRIRNFYEREAEVVCPPVDAKFYRSHEAVKDYYLVVSAFVPYKRVDVVIEAFNLLDRELIIVGDGPLSAAYRKLKKSGRITFLGSLPAERLRKLYSEARALVFPTEEDFGIVPLEAQACGAPVIAYGKGGALESVQAGIFFKKQTAEAVRQAVSEFEKRDFNRSAIPHLVSRFDKEHFKERMLSKINQALPQRPVYVAH